jgi:hypothetical protein
VSRVVENERGGVITYVQAGMALPTTRPMSAKPRTPCLISACPVEVVSRARAGCITRDRSFFLHFKSRRQPEGHEEPRSVAVPYYQELTERIIGVAIKVHRHSGPGLLESFYAAALCRALKRWDSGTARSRHAGEVKG